VIDIKTVSRLLVAHLLNCIANLLRMSTFATLRRLSVNCMRPDVLGKILSKWEVRPVSIDHADCHSNYIDSSSA